MGSQSTSNEQWEPGRVVFKHKRFKQTDSNPTDHNYWTPLTSQVEELEAKHHHRIELDDNHQAPEVVDTSGST